jgi:hypothetical protein
MTSKSQSKFNPHQKLFFYLNIPIAINLILITHCFFPFLRGELDSPKTTMTFDGELVFDEGNLTFSINNRNKGDSKILFVYGLDKEKSVNISASRITDETTKRYAEDIKFDNKSTLPLNSSHENELQEITVTIPDIYPGSYEGSIFIKGNDTNLLIPVRVETGPKVYVVLTWVVIGILTSIIFWEIIKYFVVIKDIEENKKLIKVNKERLLQKLKDHKKVV